ncbi:MAG: S8 family serine peptidase [Candidatus Omnitrophota bacterium]
MLSRAFLSSFLFALFLVTNLFLEVPNAIAKANSLTLNGVAINIAARSQYHPFLAKATAQSATRHAIVQFKRPLTPKDREKIDVRFLHYLPESRYFVAGRIDVLNRLGEASQVAGLIAIPSAAKLEFSLRRKVNKLRENPPSNKTLETVKAIFFQDVSFQEAHAALLAHGAALEATRVNFDFRQTINAVSIPSLQLDALADEDGVYQIAPIDPPPQPLNINAQDASNVDEIQPGGISGYDLDGSGVTVGVWDAGPVRVTHEQIIGRATQQDGEIAIYSNHASHVAGIIGGNGIKNPQARGMAPNATLLCWDFMNDLAEIDANAHRVSVSNHSYRSTHSLSRSVGDETPGALLYGVYENLTQAWDQIIYDRNLIAVRPAGNERVGDEYNDLCAGADAKNAITVGAIRDLTEEPPLVGDESMADFSSWGPTADGRIKPDLVANGVSLLSMGRESDNAYLELSGTSMAAAVVTGSIACLIQQFRREFGGADPNPATMKAILIHTARDGGSKPGPDYRFGWGLLDARAAADFIANHRGREDSIVWNRLTDTAVEYPMIYIGTGPIKATLVWTDPAAVAMAGDALNNVINLVNDLNLSILSDAGTFYPWTLNPSRPTLSAAQKAENHVDNVEQVYISSPNAQEYAIHIGGQVNLGQYQEFALCVSGLRAQGNVEEAVNLTVMNPSSGELLSGIVPISVYAIDHRGISRIEFRVDGEIVDDLTTGGVEGVMTIDPPETEVNVSLNWNTATTANGPHRIAASAISSNGSVFSKELDVFALNEGEDLPLVLDGPPQFGRIWPPENADWYSAQIPADGDYSLETSLAGDSPVDSIITLYGPNRMEPGLLVDDDGGDGGFSKISLHLEAGLYFVKVNGYAQATGLYGIQLKSALAVSSAPIIPLAVNGLSASGETSPENGEQWYMFRAPFMGVYKINAAALPDQVPVQVRLCNAKNPDEWYATTDSGEPLAWTFLENQYGLVKIVSPQGITTRFSIGVTTEASQPCLALSTEDENVVETMASATSGERWYSLRPSTARYALLSLNGLSQELNAGPEITLCGPDDPNQEIMRVSPRLYPPMASRILFYANGEQTYYAKVCPAGWKGSYALNLQYGREMNELFSWERAISPENPQPGDSLHITLTSGADIEPSISLMELAEYPLGNWEPENISDDGVYDPDTHTIRWTSIAQGVKHVSYEMKPRENAENLLIGFRGLSSYKSQQTKIMRMAASGLSEVLPGASSLPDVKPVGVFNHQQDIGFPMLPGYAFYDEQKRQYVVMGGGAGYSYDYYFLYKEVSGDFRLQAKIRMQDMSEGVDPYAIAALMVLDSLEADSDAHRIPFFMSWLYKNGQVVGDYKSSPDATISSRSSSPYNIQQGITLEIVRQGNQLSMYYIDPNTQERTFWIGGAIAFTDPVYVGFGTSPSSPDSYVAGYFSDVILETNEVPNSSVENWLEK